MEVVTRFAPSPTGYLHIGGVRTALFNYIFAKHHHGSFLLRIEDTDKKRSTEASIACIYDALQWLNLNWDGEAVSQSERRGRHVEVAHSLLKKGLAYKCFASKDELQILRKRQQSNGEPLRYDGRWRNKNKDDHPMDIQPVIRLKAQQEGATLVNDMVQGEVTVLNNQLDDMILLRSDGSPTYMLSVVVDDHDMGVTHVIRGDDHLTNAFRQIQVYKALNWTLPTYAHVPLIHGMDGAKLSKRHGDVGAEAYRELGFLPAAIRNYLLRLGWGHGDNEIFSDQEAINWFDGTNIGKSPSKFDSVKLTNLNAHYIKSADNAQLIDLIKPFILRNPHIELGKMQMEFLTKGMNSLKSRSKTLVELADASLIYVTPIRISEEEAVQKLFKSISGMLCDNIISQLSIIDNWTPEGIEEWARKYSEDSGLKLKEIAQPLRVLVTGRLVSPPIFEVMAIFGQAESIKRIKSNRNCFN